MSQAIGHLQKEVQSGSLSPEDVDGRALDARTHTAVSGLVIWNFPDDCSHIFFDYTSTFTPPVM